MNVAEITEKFPLELDMIGRMNKDRTIAVLRELPERYKKFKNPLKISLSEIFLEIEKGEALESSYFILKNEGRYGIQLFHELIEFIPIKKIKEIIAHNKFPLLIKTDKYYFALAPIETFASDLNYANTQHEYKKLMERYHTSKIIITIQTSLFKYRKTPKENNVSRRVFEKYLHETIAEKIIAYSSNTDWDGVLEQDVLADPKISPEISDDIHTFSDLGFVEISFRSKESEK